MFNKIIIQKVSKYLFSQIVISVVVSICLLVSLSTPRFNTFVNGKCSTASSRYHICGCKTEAHSIDLCCCEDETYTNGEESLFTAFIRSITCAGVPDQYTAVTYKISLPDNGNIFQGICRFNYIEWLETAIPASITILPPDKPPRLT